MDRFSGLVATLVATSVSLALVQPHAVAQSYQQVEAIARQVTVQIDGQNPGSGVIVAREGQTYFVLTAAHVVATDDEYEVITPDGKKYPIDYKRFRKFQGVDLALIPFTSSLTYRVVEIGRSNELKEDDPIFVSGFPLMGLASTQTSYRFTGGNLFGQASQPLSRGYGLFYLNETFAGMSGGPIFNQRGQLIGIHGATRSSHIETQGLDEIGVKRSMNMGIPVNTFLRLLPQVVSTLQLPTPPPEVLTNQVTPGDLLIQSVIQDGAGKRLQALTTINQALRLQPNYAAAYFVRGVLRGVRQDQVQGGFADYTEAIRLNPHFAPAFFNRGTVREALGDNHGAIRDYQRAADLALAQGNQQLHELATRALSALSRIPQLK
jgi:serine protease Do